MGGVDKYDQLISYYRIFLKSKKWTLRMVFHTVDMAVTNSWLEYYQDCKNLNILNKDRMDLLEFRLRLADNLIYVGKVDTPKIPRGCPRECSSLENSPSPSPTRGKYSSREVRLFYETKTDQIGHYPESDDNNDATRCINTNCKGKTHVFCLKCKVHLYFVVKKKTALLSFITRNKLKTVFIFHNNLRNIIIKNSFVIQ